VEPRRTGTFLVDKADAGTITVRIPLRLQQRGGRKVVVTPPGTDAWMPPPARIDDVLIKALARAHRWKRMIESGAASSVTEIAKREGITHSFICRLLKLNLLAPDIVEAILDGRFPRTVQLKDIASSLPVRWDDQRDRLLRDNSD